jgi:hypothetical protein
MLPKNSSFRNVKGLVKMSMTLPLSSVEAERCFSKIDVIKTKLRNLEDTTLNHLVNEVFEDR